MKQKEAIAKSAVMITALCANYLDVTVLMIFPNASICRKRLKIVHFLKGKL